MNAMLNTNIVRIEDVLKSYALNPISPATFVVFNIPAQDMKAKLLPDEKYDEIEHANSIADAI
jgi:hypothetical protein